MHFLCVVILTITYGSIEALDPKDVTFYLYTENNQNTYVILTPNNLNAVSNTATVIFFIHGYGVNRTTLWYQNLRAAYFSKTDSTFNIIEVDWSKPANQIYPIAVADTPDVGKLIGNLIVNMAKIGISLENIILTGHSLGAHVSGFAGKQIIATTGRNISRITGLDPASAPFDTRRSSGRLDKGDATVVVVIHTDAGVEGFKAPLGTLDFWPNGGVPIQPGCPGPNNFFYCSHQRSYLFFIEGVRTGEFYGTKCSSYDDYKKGLCNGNERVNFGGRITPQQTGNYYTVTRSHPPYIINNYTPSAS